MATTRSFTSTYAGKDAAKYLLPAVFAGAIADTKGVEVHSDVKFKEVLKKLASSGVVQSGGTCQDWNPTGTYTISEVVLQPKEMYVNAEFCFSDFYKLWDSDTMGAGALSEGIPAEFEQALIEEISRAVRKDIDRITALGGITGATGLYTILSGLAAQAKAGGVALSGNTLSKTNIVSFMEGMINNLPSNVPVDTSELIFFVSKKALFLYKQALAAQGINTTADDQAETVYGIEIKAIDGLSTKPDVILLQERGNIHIGYDAKSDFNEVTIIDFRFTTGADKIGVKMKFKLDVKYAFPAEAVILNAELV